jgi:formylmethanofuran dehydrogenase subunit A
LVAAEGVVPSVIWPVLFGGAIITVGFTFFFGTENLRAQMAMTILLSLLVFSQLLIIVTVDYPFTGPIKVEPTALARVLAEFGPEPNPGAPP